MDFRRLPGSLTSSIPKFIALCVGVAAVVPQTWAESPGPSSVHGQEALYRWFAGLGYPDVKGLKFVRVATGYTFQYSLDPPMNRYWDGFLMDEKGDMFTVMSFPVQVNYFQRTARATPECRKVDYEPRNLADFARSTLETLRHPPDATKRQAFPETLSQPEDLFVLAWACWRQGHEQLASEIFVEAAKKSGDGTAHALEARVANTLAETEIWNGVLAFGNPDVSRPEPLAQFEQMVRRFPSSQYAKLAAETVTTLKRMIQEDKEHADHLAHSKPFDTLSKSEQISELIFQLRDQNGHQMSQPGACDVFLTGDDKQNSPADRLVKYGYDAIPQLIGALDNCAIFALRRLLSEFLFLALRAYGRRLCRGSSFANRRPRILCSEQYL